MGPRDDSVPQADVNVGDVAPLDDEAMRTLDEAIAYGALPDDVQNGLNEFKHR